METEKTFILGLLNQFYSVRVIKNCAAISEVLDKEDTSSQNLSQLQSKYLTSCLCGGSR